MPIKNRVDPTGALHAISARGSLMGNRGNLCQAGANGPAITRYANGKRWIICSLHYQNQRLPLATLNNNTQLFFLDEATALAAGHRPCAKCRHDAYERYLAAWTPQGLQPPPLADEIDDALHQQRNLAVGDARWQNLPLAKIPNGAMVLWEEYPALVYGGWLQQWSFAGYSVLQRLNTIHQDVEVPALTPPANLAVLANGYKSQIHDTALGPNGAV